LLRSSSVSAPAAGDQEATYQIDVDGRLFTLAVRELSRRITLEAPDDAIAAFRATFRIPG
jgi:hypothetical protein